MVETDTISTFLYFGYLPKYTPNQLDFLGDQQDWPEKKATLAQMPPKLLVEEGVRVWKRAIQATLSEKDSKCHILPLSGGLDSRAILGGLLENLNSNEIVAVTYGIPGTWDFDIGKRVARTAGVSTVSIDLSTDGWEWNAAEIIKTARQIQQPTWLFDAYVNHHVQRRYGTDCVYWSGFMGDPLAGSHLITKDSTTWKQAKIQFVKRNCFAHSLNLVPPDFNPENCLPTNPFLDADFLCYDEQIDFGIRQRCLIKHIVVPEGYDCRAPFLLPEWVEFILNVPRRYREKEWLYKEILKTAYPCLFSLPTKTNVGLSLDVSFWRKSIRVGAVRTKRVAKRILPWVNWGVDSSTNYIDFNRGLRERVDLKAVVYENIQALKKRGIVTWIDIDDIWESHQHNQGNHADALMLLASLEMYIVAGKINL